MATPVRRHAVCIALLASAFETGAYRRNVVMNELNMHEIKCGEGRVAHAELLTRAHDEELLKFLEEKVLVATQRDSWQKGRDYREKSDELHNGVRFKYAWRIRNARATHMFRQANEDRVSMLQRKCRKKISGRVAQQLLLTTKKLNTKIQQRAGDLTETLMPEEDRDLLMFEPTYLLHGTSAENVGGIICNGLQPSRDGLFGRGVYLAEGIEKVDQYVVSSGWERTLKLLRAKRSSTSNLYFALVVLTSTGFHANVVAAVRQDGDVRETRYVVEDAASNKDTVEILGYQAVNSSSGVFPSRHDERFQRMQREFDSQHALSASRHEVETLQAYRTGFRAHPPRGAEAKSLNKIMRFDEYVIHDPSLVRVDYVVAFKRIVK